MKFDITRAWKNESYRESLSEEQRNALPGNPAGELSDSELEMAFGGWSKCCYKSVAQHNESYGLICEINVFSVSAVSNIALLGSVAQTCVKG